VAAALAFVVLNMGFSTTQKAKTTISSGLGEASSALSVSGKVFGSGDTTNNKLKVLAIPIKVSSGGESINLDVSTASVKYLSNSKTYDNIYAGTLEADNDGSQDTSGAWSSLSGAVTDATTKTWFDANPISAAPSSTKAFIYWTVNSNSNSILDQGEHAVVAVGYSNADRPSALDKVRVEVIVPTGAPLTVERQVPSITTSYVDLG
jgi:flagellin FlaB